MCLERDEGEGRDFLQIGGLKDFMSQFSGTSIDHFVVESASYSSHRQHYYCSFNSVQTSNHSCSNSSNNGGAKLALWGNLGGRGVNSRTGSQRILIKFGVLLLTLQFHCKCTRSELSLSNLMSQLVQLKSVLELSMAHVLLVEDCSSSSLVLHASLVVVAIVLITSQPLKVSQASRQALQSARCGSWYKYLSHDHCLNVY